MPDIRFVADQGSGQGKAPDPYRTCLIDGLERIRATLSRLEPGEPLVLEHRLGERIDLDDYTEIMRTASAAGHDVQLRLEPD